MDGQTIGTEIEKLLRFARQARLLEPSDVIPARNALLDLFKLREPHPLAPGGELPDSPVPILQKLLDYAFEIGLLEQNIAVFRDLLDARIMGLLMPRQSEVEARFRARASERSVEQAADEFYQMSMDSNYIRTDRIAKNRYWLAETPYGSLEITINLSKPEKDPKEIALLRDMPADSYPPCLLCLENVGFAGTIRHPARQNHRVIPLKLGGQNWYFQYSPYVYFHQHCIVFSEEHRPMQIQSGTFRRLLDFVDRFPHYFIGSNADLPIVGGSILNHDHFQGGYHSFPMEKAEAELRFRHPDFEGIIAEKVKWPMSVLRISGASRDALLRLADRLYETWKGYSDPERGILAHTAAGTNGAVPHNTVTPIARINKRGHYEMDLVLRNNRTDRQHPEGIFHPHRKHHHMKKENIGLIEVMGLAVLPGRLDEELAQISGLLCRPSAQAECAKLDPAHPLFKHRDWINDLIAKYEGSLSPEQAETAIRHEVGLKFLQVLSDAGVFRSSADGLRGFVRFMERCGFQPSTSS